MSHSVKRMRSSALSRCLVWNRILIYLSMAVTSKVQSHCIYVGNGVERSVCTSCEWRSVRALHHKYQNEYIFQALIRVTPNVIRLQFSIIVTAWKSLFNALSKQRDRSSSSFVCKLNCMQLLHFSACIKLIVFFSAQSICMNMCERASVCTMYAGAVCG